MNLFAITAFFIASVAAQQPSRTYIPQAQGEGGNSGQDGYQYNQGSSHQGGGGAGDGNQRPQHAAEQNAVTLKQDQEVNIDGSYHYGYEISNGIRAEESGNTENVQGGFAYKGDDGNMYTVTYTSGEDGFRPQGEHLPVPPPTPEAILEALKKNEQDEAAGIFDDGKYRPDQNDGSQNGYQNGATTNGPGFGSSGGQFGSSNQGNGGYQY